MAPYLRHNKVKWKQSGEVYLWRYMCKGRAFQGTQLHFTADPTGCDSLLSLSELLQTRALSHGLVVLSAASDPITDWPGFQCRKIRSFTKLRLSYQSQLPADRFSLSFPREDEVSLEAGREMLEEFRRGLNDVKNGDGDWSIRDDSTGSSIWFWPLAGFRYSRYPSGKVSGRGFRGYRSGGHPH